MNNTTMPLTFIFEMLITKGVTFEKRYALIKEQRDIRLREIEKLNEWEQNLKTLESDKKH